MNRALIAIFLSAVLVGEVLLTEAYSQIRETGKLAMVQQCHQNFDAMDRNVDGVVTKEEFLSYEHKRRNPEAVFKSKDARTGMVSSQRRNSVQQREQVNRTDSESERYLRREIMRDPEHCPEEQFGLALTP